MEAKKGSTGSKVAVTVLKVMAGLAVLAFLTTVAVIWGTYKIFGTHSLDEAQARETLERFAVLEGIEIKDLVGAKPGRGGAYVYRFKTEQVSELILNSKMKKHGERDCASLADSDLQRDGISQVGTFLAGECYFRKDEDFRYYLWPDSASGHVYFLAQKG